MGLTSIENENTQFVRYLHIKGIDEKRNAYQVTSGAELSDGKRLDADEAKKFNENLPNFFSEEYDAYITRKAFKAYMIGSFTSLFTLLFATKFYKDKVLGLNTS